MIISPIPPLNLPTIGTLEIFLPSLRDAILFIRSKEWILLEQDASEEKREEEDPRIGVQGLWIQIPNLYQAYIPVAGREFIRDLPFSDPTTTPALITDLTLRSGAEGAPLRSSTQTRLASFRDAKKLASILKEYALYTFSLDPENFGPPSFIVIPNHVYDIPSLNKKLFFEENDVMYQNGLLIVLSREIRDRLIQYVQIKLVHDSPGVLNYIKNSTLTEYYRYYSDFTPRENQLIFTNPSSLRTWKENFRRSQTSHKIYTSLLENADSVSPYYYINYAILGGRLSIVQNVEGGTLERALKVADRWVRFQTNIGYRAEIRGEGIEEGGDEEAEVENYVIYQEDGGREIIGDAGESSSEREEDVVSNVSVIRYRVLAEDEGGEQSEERYSALLFL